MFQVCQPAVCGDGVLDVNTETIGDEGAGRFVQTGGTHTVDLLLVQRSTDQDVVDAVRRLKPRDREIVMLYAWEDIPRAVIAEMMGMSRAQPSSFGPVPTG